MDGDLSSMLQSVLSDPAQMAQITQIAQGLMGAQAETALPPTETALPPTEAALPTAEDSAPQQQAHPLGGDKLLSVLGKAFSGGAGQSRSTALLMAMRPYMRPEKQEKLDRAMKIAQMARVAGMVMREYGGNYGV